MTTTIHGGAMSLNTTHATVQTTTRQGGMFDLTFAFHEQYMFIVYAILTPIICVIGLCGNGLGLFVVWHDFKHQKPSVYRYMFALMIFDNVYLVVGVTLGAVTILQEFNWDLANVLLVHLTYGTGYLDSLIYHTTSVLLIVMSLERLNALLRPLSFNQSWLCRYPIRIVCLTFVVLAIAILPFPLSFEIVPWKYFNRSAIFLQVKPEFLEFYIHYSFGETILSCLYPVVMLILNIAVLIAYGQYVHRRRAHFATASTIDSQQLKVTLLVLWVTVLYTLLAAPKIFLQTLIFIDSNYDFSGKYWLTFYFLTSTGDLFARLNSANDFFIYILVSGRYRKLLSAMFDKCCLRKRTYRSFSDIFSHSANHFNSGNPTENSTKIIETSAIENQESVTKRHELSREI